MKIAFLSVILFSLTSCATVDKRQDDEGNWAGLGYSETEVMEGVYRISYRAPHILMSSAPSWSGWKRRAIVLCGSDKYLQLERSEENSGHPTNWPGIMINATAYAVCEKSSIYGDMAGVKLQEYLTPKKLDPKEKQIVIASCSQSKQTQDVPKVFEAALSLYSRQEYAKAINCFNDIVQRAEGNLYKKKSYNHLYMIYEFGMGVEVDKEKAAGYYERM